MKDKNKEKRTKIIETITKTGANKISKNRLVYSKNEAVNIEKRKFNSLCDAFNKELVLFINTMVLEHHFSRKRVLLSLYRMIKKATISTIKEIGD